MITRMHAHDTIYVKMRWVVVVVSLHPGEGVVCFSMNRLARVL